MLWKGTGLVLIALLGSAAVADEHDTRRFRAIYSAVVTGDTAAARNLEVMAAELVTLAAAVDMAFRGKPVVRAEALLAKIARQVDRPVRLASD